VSNACESEQTLVAAYLGHVRRIEIAALGNPALAIAGKRKKYALPFRFKGGLCAGAEPTRQVFQQFRTRRDLSPHHLSLRFFLAYLFVFCQDAAILTVRATISGDHASGQCA
jgi:hypothetical protein